MADTDHFAFPSPPQNWGPPQTGMTLRDYFAGQALVGIVANSLGKQEKPEGAFAYGAYLIADAMLAQRDLRE